MKYNKPEIKIERFDIIENITEDLESSVIAPIPDIDMGNDNGTDLGFETASAFSEAFRNIF